MTPNLTKSHNNTQLTWKLLTFSTMKTSKANNHRTELIAMVSTVQLDRILCFLGVSHWVQRICDGPWVTFPTLSMNSMIGWVWVLLMTFNMVDVPCTWHSCLRSPVILKKSENIGMSPKESQSRNFKQWGTIQPRRTSSRSSKTWQSTSQKEMPMPASTTNNYPNVYGSG